MVRHIARARIRANSMVSLENQPSHSTVFRLLRRRYLEIIFMLKFNRQSSSILPS